jgi:hypothetical protein
MSERPNREDYDIDWSSLTPVMASVVLEFAGALREIRENETALLRLYVRNIGLLCDAMRELNAELGG